MVVKLCTSSWCFFRCCNTSGGGCCLRTPPDTGGGAALATSLEDEVSCFFLEVRLMVRKDFWSCSELLVSSRMRVDGTCCVIPLFVFRGFESSMLLLFDFVSISSKLF